MQGQNKNSDLDEIFNKLLQNFKSWTILRKSNDCIRIEIDHSEERYKGKKTKIGFGADVKLAKSGRVIIDREYGWNAPSLVLDHSNDVWALDNPPKELSVKKTKECFESEIEKIRRSLEQKIQLPNGLIARWCRMKHQMVGWGEIPTKLELKSTMMDWMTFLTIREASDGEEIKKKWQKQLFLLRDAHPMILNGIDTPDAKLYRSRRQQEIEKIKVKKMLNHEKK